MTDRGERVDRECVGDVCWYLSTLVVGSSSEGETMDNPSFRQGGARAGEF